MVLAIERSRKLISFSVSEDSIFTGDDPRWTKSQVGQIIGYDNVGGCFLFDVGKKCGRIVTEKDWIENEPPSPRS